MPRQSFDRVIVVSNSAKRFSRSAKWKKSQNTNKERRPLRTDKKQSKWWW